MDRFTERMVSPSGTVYRKGDTRVRNIALAYYLSSSCRQSGLLVDLDHADNSSELKNIKGGASRPSGNRTEYSPEFNSVVIFLVPRQHRVTVVKRGCPARVS